METVPPGVSVGRREVPEVEGHRRQRKQHDEQYLEARRRGKVQGGQPHRAQIYVFLTPSLNVFHFLF